MAEPLQVLRLSDGRRGHDNQSSGLVEALAELRALDAHELRVARGAGGVLGVLRRSPARADLVIAAGHGTHLALIVAARRLRARSVVLMKPSLPRSLFDLCIVPRHDGVTARDNVIPTLGVLNRMRPGASRDPQQGLILVGGPSRHHRWDESLLREQVVDLTRRSPDLEWRAASSPRTPSTTLEALDRIPGLAVVPFEQTSPDWLPAQLALAGRVWVTEDSVSMAYEAASCGAATGILEVPAAGAAGRVHAAVGALLESGYAVAYRDWRAGRALEAPPAPLQEAGRCARSLLERWPDLA